ncbi:MAG: DEAD/DEAH box helicase [Clostridia bacterium]
MGSKTEPWCLIGTVKDDSASYEVLITLDTDATISNHQCSCANMEIGLCPHCVAMLLGAMETLRAKGMLTADKPSSRTSDMWAARLLRAYGSEQEESRNDEALRGKVMLVPTMTIEPLERCVYLTLKIGAERFYMVKNIEEMLLHFEAKDYVTYGKKFAFTHDVEMLDEKSQALYRFLVRFYKPPIFHELSSYGVENERRRYHLTGGALDGLFTLYQGEEMLCNARRDEGDLLHFMPDEPEIQVKTSIAKDGAMILKCEDQQMLESGGRLFLLRGKELHRCSPERSKALRALMDAFMNRRGELVYGADDVASFCATVLPEIEHSVTLVDPKHCLKDHVPEAMVPHIFLDAPSRECVTAMPVAEYDGDMVAILSNKSVRTLCEASGEGEEISELQDDAAVLDASAKGAEGHRRNEREERRLRFALSQIISEEEDGVLVLTGNDAIFDFLTEDIDRLRKLGTVHISDRLKRFTLKADYRTSVGVSLDSGLLKLDIDIGDFPADEMVAALTAYRERRKYYRLRDGEFMRLKESALGDVARLSEGLQLTDKQLLSQHVEVPAFRAMYLDGLFREENRNATLRKDPAFKQLVRTVKNAADSDYAVPPSLQNILRGYQETGYHWLRSLEDCALCGILADDMGLGKTVQMLAVLLAHYSEQPQDLPSLIVCPTSLTLNWQREFEKFAPALPLRLISGSTQARREQINEIRDGETVVVSYDVIKRDVEQYEGKRFRYLVIDEAQFIKNYNTKSAQAVKAINCTQRFALTGTPIENRLSELWSIFDFLMPGYLFTYNRFRQRFEQPVVKSHDEEARARLRQMISPFILRRMKQEVLRELPPKMTTVVPVELDEEQRKLYTAATVMGVRQLSEKNNAGGEAKLMIFALLTKLRQLCCDPALCFEDYTGGSAKLDTCMELLSEAQSGGHKVLLFSQFTSMLARIRARLEEEGISYLLLQGSTPKEERLALTEKFNSDDTTVFLISLKAGGTGLNLTGADTVIHYDPWWNLAAQEQATDRAHRIGQKNSVQVYKLIAVGTIEEKIMKLQEMKGDLASIVDNEGDQSITSMSKEELLALLQE